MQHTSSAANKASTSRKSADEVISWLQDYAAKRINSNLIDDRRCIPPYVVLDFGNHGLFGLRVPKRYGGLDLEQADVVRVLEQLGAIDLTLASLLSSHANGVHTVQKYGCAALREELLPKLASGREISAFALTEPGAGSNLQAIQMSAISDSQGGWVLNGEKYLVDSGSWASVITVFARISDKSKGSTISAFAVRQGTPGLMIGGESLTMGLRGMVQNSISLRDVRVRTENLLGLPGAGIAIIEDTLSLARLNLAAKSIGGMKHCLQLIHRYAKRRPIATGMLWDNPVTQSNIVQLVSAVSVIDALVKQIARSLDAGETIPEEAFLACKVAASEYLWKTANALMQILGGRGYVDTNVAPQILRDARSFLLSEGPTETLLMYLGSRVIHVGNELEQFISVGLGAPHVADQLKDITQQICARCSKGSSLAGIGELKRSYWASSVVGELAMWTILVAATQNRNSNIQPVAQAWAYEKLKQRIAALAKGDLAEWALGHGKEAEDLIISYADSIGDVEQSLPATDTDLDGLLCRINPQLVNQEPTSSFRTSSKGGIFEATWSNETCEALNAIASSHGVTEQILLVAALGTLIYHHTDDEHVKISWQNECFHRIDIWMNFGGQLLLKDLLTQVAEALNSQSASPAITLNNASSGVCVILATTPTPLQDCTSDAALTVLVKDDGIRKSEWRYDGQSLGRVPAATIAARVEELLRSWSTHPHGAISHLSVLPDTQRDLVIFRWNETASSYPKDVCVHQLFEQQVAHAPDRLAVVFDEEALSYRELNVRADKFAGRLRKAGVRRKVLVGLCVERSLDLLVCLLGILKAGGVYVPLDPMNPRRRLTHIVQETCMPVVVVHPHFATMFSQHNTKVVYPDDWQDIEAFEREEIVLEVSRPEESAYVMYTSGSTGTPKGVEVCHRSVVNFLFSMRERPGFSEEDVLIAVTTISFDIAVLELLLPLVAGGCLVLADRRTATDGTELAEVIEKSGATVMQATPATWQMLLASGWQGRPSLKVLCGGESLHWELARSIGVRTASLWNLYGPTETTIWACVEKIENLGVISIGRPIANTHVYLLDKQREPVPVGVPGEIFIGGEGIAQGYWKRPDLTAERFVPNPFLSGERIYQTGDCGRFLSDGRIEHLGRLDDQVKIRGFRIELGEIETALSRHGAIHQVSVVARQYAPEDVRLVAYVALVSGTMRQGLIPELQKHVQEYVPEYMVPLVYIILDSFPLTPNGKIDRKALPNPENCRPELDSVYLAPRTAVEDQLAQIWAEALLLDRVGVDDDFLHLGGHSLIATHLIAKVGKTFDIDLTLRTLFEFPTVAQLAKVIVESRSKKLEVQKLQRISTKAEKVSDEGTKHLLNHEELLDLRLEHQNSNDSIQQSIPPRKTRGSACLSFAQQRFWFLNQLEPQNPAYNQLGAFRLRGELDLDSLQRALNQIVARHEVLRTTFSTVEGEPIQIIAPSRIIDIPVVNLRDRHENDCEAEVQRVMYDEGLKPFDLAQGPLLRMMLLRLAEQHHILVLTMHHIVTDGWSNEVFTCELSVLYEAFHNRQTSSLPELTTQCADYAEWQREWLQGEVLERQLAYWEKKLEGIPVTLNLPLDRPRPAIQNYRGGRATFALSRELSQELKALGVNEGATLFMTLLAAFQTLLYRYAAQEDFAVGSPIAGRKLDELEGLMGLFVNTLVLRSDLSGNPRFSDLLSRVREVALSAYDHQDLPFEKLVEVLQPERSLSHSPFFQVLFVLENIPISALKLPGLEVARIERYNETTKFDLTLTMVETAQSLTGFIEYDKDLFDAPTIAQMVAHFEVLLEGIVANPDRRISELPLLTEPEKHQLLVEWNPPNSSERPSLCIHQLFDAQVARTPEEVAVVHEKGQLTFAALAERANQLAHWLKRHGVGPDVRVGICLERGVELISSLLGILKAGGAYVPLDPAVPANRWRFMLEDADVTMVLTSAALRDRMLAGLGPSEPLGSQKPPVLAVDVAWPDLADLVASPCLPEVQSENLAYVMYTSGSTGQPKGVAIQHRSVVALVQWAQEQFLPEELAGVLASTSISFDLSVFELFVPLSSGGTIVLAENALAVPTLAAAMQVTLLNSVPSALKDLLWMQSLPPSLRIINLAGEPLQTALVQQLYALPNINKVYDLYGPTETTTYSTVALRTSNGPDTIGQPIRQEQVYIVDAHQNLMPVSLAGEILIGGVGLARGYHRQPDMTAEKFIPHPFSSVGGARLYRSGDMARHRPDGALEFLGRQDHQVKIRGYRIELGEIESVLRHHPEVQTTVVVCREEIPGDKQVVGYVVPRQEPFDVPALRAYLQARLPDYMVPNAFVVLEQFPLTANGKVDHQVLPAPDGSNRTQGMTYVAPRTVLEKFLAEVWQEVLKVERIGIQDNFFQRGGHSLLATQVMARLRNALELDIPLRIIFEKPTVEELAQCLETLLTTTFADRDQEEAG